MIRFNAPFKNSQLSCRLEFATSPPDHAAHRYSYGICYIGSQSCILPSDSVEKAQRRERSAYVHGVHQDETEGPLHTLLSPLGHERWDPEHAAAEALETLQEAIPPLFTDQVHEGSLHHRGIHGHQVGPSAHVMRVFLHRCQVTPEDKQGSATQYQCKHMWYYFLFPYRNT